MGYTEVKLYQMQGRFHKVYHFLPGISRLYRLYPDYIKYIKRHEGGVGVIPGSPGVLPAELRRGHTGWSCCCFTCSQRYTLCSPTLVGVIDIYNILV